MVLMAIGRDGMCEGYLGAIQKNNLPRSDLAAEPLQIVSKGSRAVVLRTQSASTKAKRLPPADCASKTRLAKDRNVQRSA